MDDQIILEEFHDAHGKAGALLRRVAAHDLDTAMIVKLGQEPMHLTQHTVFRREAGADWSSFDYSDGVTRVHGECDERGEVTLQGVRAPELAGAVPSHAAHRVVEGFIRTEDPTLRFREFSEATGDVWESVLVRAGDDQIVLPDGVHTFAHRVELHRGGALALTFWTQGIQIVASDGRGTRSYLVDTPEELWDGLDADVVAHIDEFLLAEVDPRSTSARAQAS